MAVAFPPVVQASLQTVIPAYVFDQFSDDDDVQAFKDAYNSMAQQYLDWFNTINLPDYTGTQISGLLLDWVATNLYGLRRPVLPAGRANRVGPFNTYELNTLQFNQSRLVGGNTFYTVSDDIYKRILTWQFYKGDGPVVSIRWLKRRVMRFLSGINGTDTGTDATYDVSIQIAAGTMTITLAGASASNPVAPLLAAAMSAGVLETPFQFTVEVVI